MEEERIMYITPYFWGFVLLLMLVGCSYSQQESQAHNQHEITETARQTNEITKQSSTVRHTERSAPTSIVKEAKEPALVDQLPLDEPWILGSDNNSKNHIMSVSNKGELQKLHVPVVEIIERHMKPPLLVAHATEASFTLIDTENWQHIPLNIPSNTNIQGFFISPDQTQLVFNTTSRQPSQLDQSLWVVNIQTGEIYTIENSEFSDNELPPVDVITPVGWRDHILYAHMQTSATSIFWRIDLAQTPLDIRQEKVIGATGIWAFSPPGNAFVWDDAYDDLTLRLRNLVTGEETYLDNTQRAVFSQDGHFLASIRASSDEQKLEFVLYDLTQPDFVTQAPIQRVDLPERTKLGELQWGDNYRSILISNHGVFERSTETLVVTADGSITVSTALSGKLIVDYLSPPQHNQIDQIPPVPAIALPKANEIYEVIYMPSQH